MRKEPEVVCGGRMCSFIKTTAGGKKMTLQNLSCVCVCVRNQTKSNQSAGMHFLDLGDNMKIQQLPVFPF